MENVLDKANRIDQIITQVRVATEFNDHNGARIILAQAMDNIFLIECYIHLEGLQGLFGHMPESLIELRRTELDPKLIAELEKVFPGDIDRIKSAL